MQIDSKGAGGLLVRWWFTVGSCVVHVWFTWFMVSFAGSLMGSLVVHCWFAGGSLLVRAWFTFGSAKTIDLCDRLSAMTGLHFLFRVMTSFIP